MSSYTRRLPQKCCFWVSFIALRQMNAVRQQPHLRNTDRMASYATA